MSTKLRYRAEIQDLENVLHTVMGFGRSEPEADWWLDRYFELIGRARLPLALLG